MCKIKKTYVGLKPEQGTEHPVCRHWGEQHAMSNVYLSVYVWDRRIWGIVGLQVCFYSFWFMICLQTAQDPCECPLPCHTKPIRPPHLGSDPCSHDTSFSRIDRKPFRRSHNFRLSAWYRTLRKRRMEPISRLSNLWKEKTYYIYYFPWRKTKPGRAYITPVANSFSSSCDLLGSLRGNNIPPVQCHPCILLRPATVYLSDPLIIQRLQYVNTWPNTHLSKNTH